MNVNRQYALWGGIALVLVAIVAADMQHRPGVRGMGMDGSVVSMYNSLAAFDDEDLAVTASAPMMAYEDKLVFASETAGLTAADVAQRIIKTADLTLQVDAVADSVDAISTLATDKGGFVQSSNFSEDSMGYKSGWISIRVPVENFESALSDIKAMADKVIEESTNGQDVTEQYTDLEARLNAAKAQEAQYITILGTAKTVGEVLAVQEHLSTTRSEIESLQGQLNYLGNRTELATISISVTENTRVTIPTEKFELWEEIQQAAKTLIIAFQRIVTAVIWLVIVGGPFTLIALALYKLFRARQRRR